MERNVRCGWGVGVGGRGAGGCGVRAAGWCAGVGV